MAGYLLNPDGTFTVTGDVQIDLQADLQAVYGPTVTVVSNAYPSTTLADMLSGAGFPMPFQQYLASIPAQLVVENFAVNDRLTISADAFRAELIQFVTMVRAAGKTPILEEPGPSCNLSYPASQDVEYTYADGQTDLDFVEEIDSVAAQENVPLIQQYLPIKALPSWCSMMPGGHPNAELYAIKAQNEVSVLDPLIKQMQKS